MSTLIVFRVIDIDTNKRIEGAVVRATNAQFGNFAVTTNSCGEFAAPNISPGHYEPVVISAPGYADYVYPSGMDLSDSGLITIGIKQVVLPITEPTREQVCNVYCGFQGISILTKQFGWIPAFGPETTSLNDEDLISYCQQMKGFGFTHVEFDISWQYDEPSYHYPIPGADYTNRLDEVCRRLMIITNQGMLVKFSLAGDGLSNAQRTYNDPQGWTYGYEWLIENLGRILFALRDNPGRDLTKYTEFVPGYDGVFYGWSPGPNEVPDLQPQRVLNFIHLFRSILPNGYLGIEHTPGNIPTGEGSTDWKTNGRLDGIDTLFTEFDLDAHRDSSWQIIARFSRPYIRPIDQPAGDDTHPDFYMEDCSRGKRFYIIYEFDTYRWVRGAPYSEILADALYLHNMAPTATICALLQ